MKTLMLVGFLLTFARIGYYAGIYAVLWWIERESRRLDNASTYRRGGAVDRRNE